MVDLLLVEFAQRDERRFGQSLIIFGDLDLLAVFEHFFQVIRRAVEFGKLGVQFFFKVRRDLVGALGDDNDGFVDVSGFTIVLA